MKLSTRKCYSIIMLILLAMPFIMASQFKANNLNATANVYVGGSLCSYTKCYSFVDLNTSSVGVSQSYVDASVNGNITALRTEMNLNINNNKTDEINRINNLNSSIITNYPTKNNLATNSTADRLYFDTAMANNRTAITTEISNANTSMKNYVDAKPSINPNDYWNMSKGKLGINNLTACSDGQIIKMSGADWVCGADSTGAGATGFTATGSPELYNQSSTIYFNQTVNNASILNIAQRYNESSWVTSTLSNYAENSDVINNYTALNNRDNSINASGNIQSFITAVFLKTLGFNITTELKTYFDSLYLSINTVLTPNAINTTTQHSGHVTGAYNSMVVINTNGLSGENITSGTVADARIASTITRDSEVPSLETDSKAYNGSLQRNITAQACSGSDKISSFKDGVFTCTTDSTGAGASGFTSTQPDEIYNISGALYFNQTRNNGTIVNIASRYNESTWASQTFITLATVNAFFISNNTYYTNTFATQTSIVNNRTDLLNLFSVNDSALSSRITSAVTGIGTNYTASKTYTDNLNTSIIATYQTKSDTATNLTNKANWDTAYGWGNHATQGYLKNGTVDVNVSVVKWNQGTYTIENSTCFRITKAGSTLAIGSNC